MSAEVKTQSKEAEVADDFKRFVRKHLLGDVSPTHRAGEWELDDKGQLFPTPVNYIGFTAIDLEPYPDEPEEQIADDGAPKQEMSITVGYRADGEEHDPLYELSFYERAVDDPDSDPAFNLRFMGGNDHGVGPEVVEHFVNGIAGLELQGKMKASAPPQS